MAWPPELDALKADMKIADERDDERLQQVLDAAVVFVQHVHSGTFEFDLAANPLSALPEPDADIELGTLRLAGRWHIRRRSPDALIAAGDLGQTRVPSFDPDIDRLLRIGRYRGAVIG